MTNQTVTELIERSNRLGADQKNTNYAGGNTSAKGTDVDPVTGEEVELVWVKGSGGDLGTLTESGLAALRLDRMRALVNVYPGVEREDEMVAAFDYCLHGKGGAAPSIDTAMHGLVDAAHVDHLHPDAGHRDRDRRGRRGADREGLRRQGGLGALAPSRLPARPRHRRDQGSPPRGGGLHPRWPRHHRLGRHQSEEAERSSLWIIDTAAAYIEANATPEPFGPALEGYGALPDAERRAKAAALAADDPRHRLARPADGRPLHRRRRGPRLPGVRRAPAARGARHLLPRPLPAHQGQAAGARPPGRRHGRGVRRPAR